MIDASVDVALLFGLDGALEPGLRRGELACLHQSAADYLSIRDRDLIGARTPALGVGRKHQQQCHLIKVGWMFRHLQSKLDHPGGLNPHDVRK